MSIGIPKLPGIGLKLIIKDLKSYKNVKMHLEMLFLHNFLHDNHKTYRLYIFNLEFINRGHLRSKGF